MAETMRNLVTYILLSKLPYLGRLISQKPVNETLPDGTWNGAIMKGLNFFSVEGNLSGSKTMGNIVGEFTDEYGKWTVVEFRYNNGELHFVICSCNILPFDERYKIITDYNNKRREQTKKNYE